MRQREETEGGMGERKTETRERARESTRERQRQKGGRGGGALFSACPVSA